VETIEHFGKAISLAEGLPTTPALRREQIRLQVALITPLIVKGYAAPETKAATERARLLIEQAEVLGEPPDDPLLLFSVLYGFWVANYVAFNGDALREHAAQFLPIAEKHKTKDAFLVAHRLMGTTLLVTGNIAESREHHAQAIAHYDATQHISLATRFGQDAKVSTLSFRALAVWVLGYPEAYLADVDQALTHARQINHAASLMFALSITSLSSIFCGRYAAGSKQSDEVIALANEKGALFWKAWGLMNRGWLLALSGNAPDAVNTIACGISEWRSTGATMKVPFYLSCLAKAHAELGQFDAAWRSIDEAMTAIKTTKECWCDAEVYRVAGEIALRLPAMEAAKAEAYFDHALAVARVQQAKSWELRAAMSMARLWRDQGEREEARDLLAPVYGWFTEGFDTRDLKEAKALLDELYT
jgi:predicted ATPase